MKKLYFFLMVLLSLVGVTQAFAQEDDVTIPVNMNNGKWISWNETPSNAWARTWFSTTTPAISICTATGSTTNPANLVEDIRGKQFYAANNMSTWGEAKTDLMFFTRFGSSDAPYEITVAKGWYIKSVEFDFNCANNKNEEDGSLQITIGEEDPVASNATTDNQHISWTNEDKDVYSIQFLLHRIEGTYNFARTSNFTVVVAPLGEQQQALADLAAIYNQYKDVEFTAGDKPGQYDEEAVQAFKDALVAADPDGPDFNAETIEEIKALGQALKDAYEAVLKTKVPMSLETGYYRIRSNMKFNETYTDQDSGEEIVNTNIDKYLSQLKDGKKFYAIWATIKDMETDAQSLWKVTMTPDSLFDIVNAGFEARFVDQASQNTAFAMSAESDSLLAIDPIGFNEDEEVLVNIRMASRPANDYYYFHCYNHKSGNLTTQDGWSYIVRWTGDALVSQWVFEPVDESEALDIINAFAPTKAHIEMVDDYKALRDSVEASLKAALDIANVKITVNKDKNLITSADQLSSPSSDSDEGQNLGYLIDGDASTYWHSNWHDGSLPNHTHYLQVALAEPVDEEISLTITRRQSANDHVTRWGVYGSNNAESDEWEFVASLMTPYGNNKETISSLPFSTRGYQYLRFYIDGTSSNRGYGHASEFQLNPATLDAEQTVQYFKIGEPAVTLNNVIGSQASIDLEEDITAEFTALQAAYDAFNESFVDPQDLKDALAKTKDADKMVVIGSNPGQWESDEEAKAFTTLYTAAEEYYNGGVYNKEEVAKHVEALTSQKDKILNSANKIQTGKWYKIRFDSETNFETNGWSLIAGWDSEKNAVNDYNKGQIITSQPLWDKVIAVVKQESNKIYYDRNAGKNQAGNDSIVKDSTTVYTIKGAQPTEVGSGNGIYFINENDLSNKDMALFRFVAVGDSAYVMQNKATGLFLRATSGNGSVSASLHPALFDASAIGYGKNLISVRTLSTGYKLNYLHGQKAGNALVTWNADTPESASALYIEEVETVADGYVGQANIMMEPGSINGICYPGELTPTTTGDAGQAWTVSGIEDNKITLAKITDKIHAGRPFIFVFGPASHYQEGQPAEPAAFMVSTDNFAAEPQTGLALKGTYARTGLHKGDVYFTQNKMDVATVDYDGIMVENPVYVAGNSAYISNEPAIDHNAELEVIFDENAEDGIQAAIEAVSKAGAVYTIDGRLVSRRATINELSRFGKGLYILNGHKVIVK